MSAETPSPFQVIKNTWSTITNPDNMCRFAMQVGQATRFIEKLPEDAPLWKRSLPPRALLPIQIEEALSPFSWRISLTATYICGYFGTLASSVEAVVSFGRQKPRLQMVLQDEQKMPLAPTTNKLISISGVADDYYSPWPNLFSQN